MICPFCELLRTKERPFVFENYYWFAFEPIGPINDGHVLIVPKRHIDRIEDLTVPEWQYLFFCFRQFKSDYYNIGVNAGSLAGQTVFHLHIHFIPREEGDVEDVKGGIVGALGEKVKGSRMWEYLKTVEGND
jgi:diadenosine tetraphosphate (Ap4A) HIT family hydrolase